jgi:hypothetical protein
MTESQIQSLIEKEGALLEQFLFIIYYTDPTKDRVRLIVDDGSIKLTVPREKFIYLFNELLQPRTMEMEKNFQRIKASLNSYGKWYYYDRIKNIFKELAELPKKEHISPQDLFATSEPIKEKLDEHFKAVVNKYSSEVIQKAPIPKQSNKIINKFYSFFRGNKPR